jgi:hypothetical protein
MVSFIVLLTYLAGVLLALTAAAPLDEPSVMLPIGDPSLEQPHTEWLFNDTSIGELDRQVVSRHLPLFVPLEVAV